MPLIFIGLQKQKKERDAMEMPADKLQNKRARNEIGGDRQPTMAGWENVPEKNKTG